MIKPLNGWIVIEPLDEAKDEEVSSGGIILQRQHETPQTRVAKARVIKISELFHEGRTWESELKEGDVVMYERSARQKQKDSDGTFVYMVREVDIYLVIDED